MFGNIHRLQMSSVCGFDLIIRDGIVSRKYRRHIRSSLSGKEFESELETWNKVFRGMRKCVIKYIWLRKVKLFF